MTSPAIIRRATPDDADAITPVHVASIRTLCAKDYTPEQIEAWAGWKSPEKYRAAMAAGGGVLCRRGRSAGRRVLRAVRGRSESGVPAPRSRRAGHWTTVARGRRSGG